MLGLAVAVVSFLWIAWITISKFNEARAGRAEWGEVGLTEVMAAGVMIFIIFLLTEASKGVLLTIFFGSTFFQRIKRGRPDN